MNGIQINYLSRWLGHSSTWSWCRTRRAVLTGYREHIEKIRWWSAFIQSSTLVFGGCSGGTRRVAPVLL